LNIISLKLSKVDFEDMVVEGTVTLNREVMCAGVGGLRLAATAALCEASVTLKVGNLVTNRRTVKVFRNVLRSAVSGYLKTDVVATMLVSKSV
jgi:hypothetical protein